MRRFKIAFETTAAKLPTIVSLLADQVQNFSVHEANGDHAADTPQAPRKRKATPRLAPEGTITGQHVIAFLKQHNVPIGLDAVGQHLVEQGFAFKSASPLLSQLVARNLVTRIGHGRYVLTANIGSRREST